MFSEISALASSTSLRTRSRVPEPKSERRLRIDRSSLFFSMACTAEIPLQPLFQRSRFLYRVHKARYLGILTRVGFEWAERNCKQIQIKSEPFADPRVGEQGIQSSRFHRLDQMRVETGFLGAAAVPLLTLTAPWIPLRHRLLPFRAHDVERNHGEAVGKDELSPAAEIVASVETGRPRGFGFLHHSRGDNALLARALCWASARRMLRPAARLLPIPIYLPSEGDFFHGNRK